MLASLANSLRASAFPGREGRMSRREAAQEGFTLDALACR
jgi:hypothetical protein